MQTMIYFLKKNFTSDKFPCLTIVANVFLGYAFGKILTTPADELGDDLFTKMFLILGACLFGNYLLCVRKASRGINRTLQGKLRPFLKDALLCAALNGVMLFLATALFFFKVRFL